MIYHSKHYYQQNILNGHYCMVHTIENKKRSRRNKFKFILKKYK
jgi:hypothetical protein